jgi:hypothetical protein
MWNGEVRGEILPQPQPTGPTFFVSNLVLCWWPRLCFVCALVCGGAKSDGMRFYAMTMMIGTIRISLLLEIIASFSSRRDYLANCPWIRISPYWIYRKCVKRDRQEIPSRLSFIAAQQRRLQLPLQMGS